MYIEKINGPADVKRLSAGELETLSEEVRGVLLKKLSEHGGHVGPNLGMVEATVALHYVFNSPADKICLRRFPPKLCTQNTHRAQGGIYGRCRIR